MYVGGVYEMHSDGSVTKYYAGQGRMVAIRSVPSRGGAGALVFPVTDHLGSTRALLDQGGAVVGTASYWPYGAMRPGATGVLGDGTPPSGTDKLYTGQRMESGDAALGLYNYNARFYSTTLGAFVSADTVGDGLNRYAYVHGNPVAHTDPSGTCSLGRNHCTEDEIEEFMNCGLGVSCHPPDGVDAASWARFSAWVLGQNQFWGWAALRGRDSFNNQRYVYIIATSVSVGSIDPFTTISAGGWATLGALFYQPGAWFRASLHDLMMGGNEVAKLTPREIVGADEWWLDDPANYQVLTNNIYLLGNVGWDTDAVTRELEDATASAGNWFNSEADPFLGGVNGQGWSPDQIGMLARAGLNVDQAAAAANDKERRKDLDQCIADRDCALQVE